MGVIYELARQTLRHHDELAESGWIVSPLPHEAEVRAALARSDSPSPEGLRGILVDVLGDALDGYGDPEAWADVILDRLNHQKE